MSKFAYISNFLYLCIKETFNATKIMENIQSSKKKMVKKEKMSLQGYYNSLKRPTPPKKEFVQRIARCCGVDVQSVRNWCKYGIRPSCKDYVRILVEETGIKEEDLWED